MSKIPKIPLVTAEMLAELPPLAIAAWAGRCAMRVQPLIRADSFGQISRTETAGYIETFDIAATLAMVTLPAAPYASRTVIPFATHAADAAKEPTHCAARAASAAASTISSTKTEDVVKNAISAYDYTTRAAVYATDAISANTSTCTAAFVDYKYLVQHRNENDLETFIAQPLWQSSEIQHWQLKVESWEKELASQFPELHGMSTRHVRLLEGVGIDYHDARERINNWLNRYDLQEESRQSDPKKGSEDSSESEKKDEQSEDPEEQSIETPATDRRGPATSMHDGSTTDDCLDRKPLVQSLAAMFAAKKQATPFTLALLGDWGAGKSSVMDQVQENLESSKSSGRAFDFLFAKFNAWQYEHTDDVRAGLAQEIVKGLTDDLDFWGIFDLKVQFAAREHSFDFLKAIIGFFAVLIVTSVVFWLGIWKNLFTDLGWGGEVVTTGFLGGFIAFIIYLWKTYKPLFDHPIATKLQTYLKLPDYGEQLGVVPVMRHHIETICQMRGVKEDKPDKRLVVFIDDLDRCGHKCIMQTLDAVRLVMDIPNVIVVIAIDYRIAFAAVANHYADLADDDRSEGDIARDYLGKIIQLPVELPEPTSMRQFIRERLFETADKEETERLSRDKKRQSLGEKLKLLITESDESEIDSTADDDETVVDTLTLSDQATGKDDISESESDLVPELMPESPEDCRLFEYWTGNFEFNNPRQLIRLRNAYRLLTQLDHNRYPETSDNQRMAMLFWLEFLHQKNEKTRQKYEDILIPPKTATVDGLSNQERDLIDTNISVLGIRPQLTDGLGDELDEQRTNYLSLKRRISLFVLPAKRVHSEKAVGNPKV